MRLLDRSNPRYLKHSTFSRLELPRDSPAGEDGFAFWQTMVYEPGHPHISKIEGDQAQILVVHLRELRSIGMLTH